MERLRNSKEALAKRYFIGVVVALLLAITVTVFAFGPGAGPDRSSFVRGDCEQNDSCAVDPRGGFGGTAGLLANLSKDQMERMWQARERFRNDTQKVRYELFLKRLELRSLYTDPNADEATILAKQKELNALRQSMMDRMAQLRLEQRKILTPGQLKKLGDAQHSHGFSRMGMVYRPDGWLYGRGAGYGFGRNDTRD